MTYETINILSWVWIAIAILTFVSLNYITAPFGRHTHEKWGPSVNNKWGWCLMELPSFTIMIYFFLNSSKSWVSFVWILFALWLIHYVNRTFIYPLRIKSTPKKMPLLIVCSAILFNVINAGLNGYYLSECTSVQMYDAHWLFSLHFWIGLFLFLSGLWINWKSDNILLGLRKEGDSGYYIPQGFLFNYISAPNLFGEIIEWIGFAVMAWNLPALSFAIWTLANLVPRAMKHHEWYLRKFKDYPIGRKAVFPYIL